MYRRTDPFFNIYKGRLYNIISPIYGLSDAADASLSASSPLLTSHLYLPNFTADDTGLALLAAYVDFIILSFALDMMKASDAIASLFLSKASEFPPLGFARSQI